MNGHLEEKALHKPRWHLLCGAPSHRAGLHRVHPIVWACRTFAARHSPTTKREEQRPIGRVQQVHGTTGMEVKRYTAARPPGAGIQRPDHGNKERRAAEPCDVVRDYMGFARLGARDGHKTRTVSAQRVCETHPSTACSKNKRLIPSDGIEGRLIAPSDGIETAPLIPSDGAIRPFLPTSLIPPDGAYIELTICSGISGRPKPVRNIPEKGSG